MQPSAAATKLRTQRVLAYTPQSFFTVFEIYLRRASSLPQPGPAGYQRLVRLRSTSPVLPSTSSFTRSPWAFVPLTS